VGEPRGFKAELLVWSVWAVELRSYGFHYGQAAAELGQQWRGGSGAKLVDGKWSTSCTRARRIEWQGQLRAGKCGGVGSTVA
jgi:hypothetical protein